MTLKIGFIGVDQICFTGDKAAEYARGEQELSVLAKKLGFALTAYGNTIITRVQAEEAARYFAREGIDFLLVQNSSFAAGETILPLAKLGLPIGLWAVPEHRESGYLPLNSFCGVNMYASIITNYLKHHNIKYKYFFGHGDDPRFTERLSITVRALTAIKKLKQSKVALVGGIAPGFNDLYFDERIIEKKLGVNIQRNHEYEEIKSRALSYGQPEIDAAAKKELACYKTACPGAAENIQMNIRFTKAYQEFAAEYGYDALAISCWPKIQEDFLACTCQSMAALNSLGIPAACEGDLPGALAMLLLKYLSGGQVTTLLDLVAFDERDDTIQLWHCGPTAIEFAGSGGVRLSVIKENIDTIGIEKRYLRHVHDMVIQGGDATIAMFLGDFNSMFIAGGAFTDSGKETFHGSAGWFGNMSVNGKPAGALDMVHTILTLGIQHHYPVVMGRHTKELIEAAAWLGLKLTEKVEYTDYLEQ